MNFENVSKKDLQEMIEEIYCICCYPYENSPYSDNPYPYCIGFIKGVISSRLHLSPFYSSFSEH